MRSLTHDEFLALRRFPAFDGLRAMAALMVVVFHFGGQRWTFVSGWIGVHLFFVLSGFLITTLALREEAQAPTGRISLADFYVRRLFRIVPVYLIVLAATVAYYVGVGGYRSSRLDHAMPYYLTFFNEYAGIGVFVQSWTLGVEQKFYLFWPLLAFAAGAIAFGRRVAVTLGAIALACVAFLPWPDRAVGYLVILLGCLLAVLMHDRRGFALVRPLTHPVVGVVIAMLWVVAQLLVEPGQHVMAQSKVIAGYGLVVVLLVPTLIAPGPLGWLLSRRPFVFVGERSYSLYLAQLLAALVLDQAVTVPPGGRRALLVALVGLATADLLYRCVERPMIRAGRHLVHRRHIRYAADGKSVAVNAIPTPIRARRPVRGDVAATSPRAGVVTPRPGEATPPPLGGGPASATSGRTTPT